MHGPYGLPADSSVGFCGGLASHSLHATARPLFEGRLNTLSRDTQPPAQTARTSAYTCRRSASRASAHSCRRRAAAAAASRRFSSATAAAARRRAVAASCSGTAMAATSQGCLLCRMAALGADAAGPRAAPRAARRASSASAAARAAARAAACTCCTRCCSALRAATAAWVLLGAHRRHGDTVVWAGSQTVQTVKGKRWPCVRSAGTTPEEGQAGWPCSDRWQHA